MLSSSSTPSQRRARYRRSYIRGESIALALLLGLCLSLSGFATAWAAGPQKTLPAIPQAPASAAADPICSNCGKPPLVNNGGPIQSSPEVLLDFWGPNWANNQSKINYIVGLFSNLSGGGYLNILRQYGVHNRVTLVPVQGAAYFHDSASPGNLPAFNGTNSDSTALNEMKNAIQVAGRSSLTYYPNLQVIIFPDTNAHYGPNAQGCGWHNYDWSASKNAYSIVPYPNLANCTLANPVSGDAETVEMAAIATHEFAEAVTDPQPGIDPAWTSSGGGEIGDLCGGESMPYTPPSQPGSYYVTQELFSNADANLSANPPTGCVTHVGTAYASPDSVSPYVGQHTVQGSILGRYNAGGGANYPTVLGEPLTEEAPITGGSVTYFAGKVCDGGYPIPSSISSGYGGSGQTSGSAIYFSHATSAHEVNGCIYRYYQSSAIGGPTNPNGLGFPISDETAVTGGGTTGRVSYFAGQYCLNSTSIHPDGSGSAIYYSGSAFFVRGCIYDRYQGACGDGTTQSCVQVLGLPASSEITLANGGAVSYFVANSNTLCNGGISIITGETAGSAIYYSSATGAAYEVQGCIFQHYASIGGSSNSNLGYPTSDEHIVPGGWVSNFQGTACGSKSWGHIFSNGAAGGGTFEVDGCIDDAYIHAYGGPSGTFGWPISDKQAIGSGYVSTFQGETCNQGGGHAQIYYSAATQQAHMVQGCIDSTYLKCGGAAGPLGFPISDEQSISGDSNTSDRESLFQNGYIFWQNGQARVVPVGVTVNC